MKIFKKTKLTTVVGLLAGATLVYFNMRHTLNDYGIRDNKKLHPAVLAQANTTGYGSTTVSYVGTSTTGTSTADYVYLEKLVAKEIMNNKWTANYAASATIKELPIGVTVDLVITNSGTYSGYYTLNCEGLALARCNQNLAGVYGSATN